MSAPAAIANAVADALGVDDVELPRRRARLGAGCEAVAAPATSARASLEEALALLAEHGDDAKVMAGGQSLVPHAQLPAGRAGRARRPQPARRARGIEVADGARARRRARARSALSSATPGRSPPARCSRSRCPTSGTWRRATAAPSAGSIAHADAAAELPLLLRDARRGDVEGPGSGARIVAAEQFFVSHLTSSSSRTRS